MVESPFHIADIAGAPVSFPGAAVWHLDWRKWKLPVLPVDARNPPMLCKVDDHPALLLRRRRARKGKRPTAPRGASPRVVEDAVPRSRLGYFADTDTAAAADIQTSLLPTGDAGSAGSAEPVLVRMTL